MDNKNSVENADVVITAIEEAEPLRDRVKRQYKYTLARMLDEAGGLDDVVEQAKASLALRLSEAVTALSLEMASAAFDDFIADVRRALSYERAHGRLKQHLPFDEMVAWKDEFRNHGWGAAAKSIIVDYLLQPGERIGNVDWFAVTLTNARTITRQDIRDNCVAVLESELESDDKVARLREAAEEKAAKEAHARRSSGTGITDRHGRYVDFADMER